MLVRAYPAPATHLREPEFQYRGRVAWLSSCSPDLVSGYHHNEVPDLRVEPGALAPSSLYSRVQGDRAIYIDLQNRFPGALLPAYHLRVFPGGHMTHPGAMSPMADALGWL